MTSSQLRLHLLLIVSLAGMAAGLVSIATLAVGVEAMAVRYPLAVACGYLTFLLLIRGWIAWHRRAAVTAGVLVPGTDVTRATPVRGVVPGTNVTPTTPGRRTRDNGGNSSNRDNRLRSRDLLDVDASLIDISLPTKIPRVAESMTFAGGRSGGGGGGAAWAGIGESISAPFDVDVDELWPVVLAVVCVLGGAIAIGYVIYSAPVLLAEVAVDAAVVTGLYKRLKKREPSHWALTVARHTAIPAMVVILFATLAGYAMQRIAPEARSIGGVIRALTE